MPEDQTQSHVLRETMTILETCSATPEQYAVASGPTQLIAIDGKTVNVRPPTTFDKAIRLNLAAAREPRKFFDLVIHKYKDEREREFHLACDAATLARDSSATVIILCANKFQALVNWCCSALDPLLHGTSTMLLEEGRLRPIDLAKMLYRFCGGEFDTGKLPYSPMPLIFKMRNQLVHDKPVETMDEDISKEVEKLNDNLISGVKELNWLPPVRNKLGGPLFWIHGEPAIQKVMKYPVAKWAADATEAVAFDMRALVGGQKAGLSLVPTDSIPSPDHSALERSGRRAEAAGC